MKILLVAIYLLFSVVQSVSADTRSTNVSWTNSSGISECGQVTSHGVNHHGVPNSNSNSVATSGNRTCVAHSYFTGQDVTYPTSGYYNRSSVQGCPSQMRAIRIEYYNGTTLVTTRNIGSNVYAGNNWNRYRLICRSWDDTAPLVSATNSSNTWSNTNISITLNASDRGVNGSNSNGSLVQARYSWSNNLNATCTSGGSTYSNGQTITQSNNGNHTLYLCARDRAGNVGTWSGTYRLDKIPPTGTLTYHDGWTNNTNQIINFTYNDTGGSGFRNYTLQRRINDTSPSFPNGSWGGWSNVSGCVNQTSGTSCLAGTLSNHRAYQYRIIIRDNAGNEATVTSPRTLQIDTTTPTIADISNSNPENLLANSSYTYQFSVGNNSGAPIVSVSGVRERHGSEDINLSFSCTSSNCSVPWNISRVDNFRLANGSRQYTFRITEMCDEAGNCSDETRNYNHNVYPDTVSTITSELIGEELSDSTNIARGNARNVRLRLRDQYNNAIIPASGIGRTISFRINSDNQLRLNQYNNNGNDSALFASNITTEIPTGTNQVLTLNNQTSTNGNYTIPFYIFAPTSNTDSLVPGEANINNIQFAINSLIEVVSGDSPQFQYTNGEGVVIQQNFIPNTNLVVRASPLFSTNFTGEIINNGFIEGADQSSEITVTRHHSTSITSPSLRLEFGEVDGDNSNVENERFNIRVNNQFLSEGNQSNWNSISQVWNNLNPTTRDITSRMIQEAGSAPRDTQSYLASIIKYNISGKNVIYPSAIIGKDAYYGI
ncbi:hypothetical protein LAT59_03915, partial [Candidatus Gracilibacteria bacterium]|nr:hypothetical protein [Candidatus Gracilibacteria bacterium]